MSLTELIPIIRALSDREKVQLFDLLKAELAREDSIAPLEHEKTYPCGRLMARMALRVYC